MSLDRLKKRQPFVSLWRAVGLIALLASLATGSQAQTKQEREYAIKAGFLYNFFSYVAWPAGQDQNTPFRIGVVGDNPSVAAIEALDGKTVKGRRIEVHKMKEMSQLTGCHLVFVTAAEQGRLREILDLTKGSPTLTVGEAEGFIQNGGVINLVPTRNRIQIEINPAAAERAGLTISSQLLRLAQIVRG